MSNTNFIAILVLGMLFTLTISACGSSQSGAEDQEEDIDLIGSIVGEVEIEEIDTEESGEAAYTGPTSLTVNLKVINKKNPKGSYRLLKADGTVVVEKGKLGEAIELNQEVYSVEFTSPLVFSNPTYTVNEVEVAGKEMTLDEVFPAGQITLHTYRGKQQNRCVPVAFTVKSETLEKDLPGKGKTCKPIILEAGTYEVLLNISKKKVQPVSMRVNSEQVSSAQIKLEK
ncbi:MAG: hypothetical protein GY847_10800 [Proteobacteria bacterium]|nr:hypothetical protein [Pseudomonadota bacterium]